jgi:adenine phosphoribosyltransferase
MDEMSSAESYRDAQEKLMTLNLLQMAFKEIEGLENMQSALERNGVEVSVANLSRYKNGKAIPKSRLKDDMLKALTQDPIFGLSIEKLITDHISENVDESGNVRITNLHLLNDSKTLKAILFLAVYQGIIPIDIDKIITAEVDGLPVAMTLAHLLNVDCVYARKKKPLGTTDFITADIQTASLGRVETIGVDKVFIRDSERVLIVDDVIRSGSTQTALVELVRRCGAKPVKVVIVAGVGSRWDKITEWNRVEFEVLKVYGKK